MSAVVESVPKDNIGSSGQSRAAAPFKIGFGRWFPATAVAVGALLSVVWTASLLALSVWALLVLV